MKKARRPVRDKPGSPQAITAEVPQHVPAASEPEEENWRKTLAHFARATGLTLALFDSAGVLRVGPLGGNPLGEALLAAGAWGEPDGICFAAAREVALRCVAQSAIAQTTLCDVLSAVAIPIGNANTTEGAIVAGWVFNNFPEPVSTNRLAGALGLSFPEIWQIVRQVSPMSGEKLALYADLLQMLADLFIKQRADTEERFQLIDELKRRQHELERAARTRDELFAVVSHELRTPLTPILGWLPLIRDDLEQGRLEQVRQGIETIERNALQEAHLIDEMLDLSRILTGRIVFAPEHVAPAQIIAQAAPAALALLRDRGLGIHTDVAEALPAVWVDRERLLQILANLVSNAVKFTPDGGLITLGARAANGFVEFFVSDTGIGVNPEAADKIFERFQQADSGTQRRYGGLGIGLSVVKNLVEMQGGEVRVESEGTDAGATFVVGFPASALPQPQPAGARPLPAQNPTKASEVNRANFQVLVVDDATDTLELMRRLLTRAGYQVSTASSASAALAAARESPPDAVISDIGMPDCDGFELLRQLRAELAPQKIAALAVSGFTGEKERTLAEQCGFEGYFTKPIDVKRLVQTLDALLRDKGTAQGRAVSLISADR